MSTVVITGEHHQGPNLLLRGLWWFFIGSWLSGIVVALAWLCLIFIVTIPAGIWLINRIPSVLTLRPRKRVWVIGQDADGNTIVRSAGRSQVHWIIRGLWFVAIGWWASAAWMAAAWLVQLTIIGLPLALLMFNRTPFIASLYRY